MKRPRIHQAHYATAKTRIKRCAWYAKFIWDAPSNVGDMSLRMENFRKNLI